MKFTYFKFANFKGIESQTLDLSKNSDSKVFTLVGLNESGKTTILEAINYFAYKPESLNALELDNYEVDDIHNLIPINKRDNFNGRIQIEAGIELDTDDITAIKRIFLENQIYLKEFSNKISYTQNYYFVNSEYKKEKTEYHWKNDFKGIVGKTRKIVSLTNDQALKVNPYIKKNLPSILYFPNFLFEFPERIYLDETIEDAKHKFYQKIIQDVLDSLNNNTNLTEHLIKRINSDDEKDKRNLNSLIGKMQKQLTEVIFKKWNQIFKKEISKTEIVLFTGKDTKGCYLEFNIKDDVDTYRIIERSLGFRWFFVYILLTQFRSFRKQDKNVFFLFDEPASNLHPSAQIELLKSFEMLPKVLYTTHSHYLINPKWLENTFVIKNEAIDYDDEVKYNSKNTNIKISKYREFAVKYPNQSNYFQPILEVLDYRPTNLELVPNVVITEGKNDYYTFAYFQDVVFKQSESIKFIPGTSSSNLETLISLYLGWAKPFLILLDSDKEGIKQKKRYEEIYGDSISELIHTYANIDNTWTDFTTEDLFTVNDKLKIQTKYYTTDSTFQKKIFNRSLQELYMKNESLDLEEATINNIQKVLSYLANKMK